MLLHSMCTAMTALSGSTDIDDAIQRRQYLTNQEVMELRSSQKQVRVPKLLTAGTVQTTGTPPNEFGPHVDWSSDTNELFVVAYINAADALGVSIGGIRAGDVIQVDSMSGLATFEKADGNPYLSSFLIVGEAAGVPDKVLKLADKVAKQFQDPEGTPKKTRDAGGRDSEGVFRRQEGGVIACMPAARGAFYSSRSRSTWIQGEDSTSPQHRKSDMPTHIEANEAFFPVPGEGSHNSRVARTDGTLTLLPWDWRFEDNAGFYKVVIRLSRSDK